ncbi:predicted protein [Verticillium alfalfae VaMs.102]|uniref:Predicted protein n=1 Tax=Verticillium alfalfae (strain VaMs.102 / ATCC MYA-4576 / FGSC 10136) TaxID=526221 RepID=C9SLW2_VERA1|nr:predicted protein [Verticillium alfalfae VaMs.102]EEY19777.1 predicted protein [Verticillium alfalfae VaMs.102]
MSSRILAASARAVPRAVPAVRNRPAPSKHPPPSATPSQHLCQHGNPWAPFRGGSLAGAGVYSYLVKEYKLSNELLTEDIYALQAAVQRVTVYVQTLEEKMDALERKRK